MARPENRAGGVLPRIPRIGPRRRRLDATRWLHGLRWFHARPAPGRDRPNRSRLESQPEFGRRFLGGHAEPFSGHLLAPLRLCLMTMHPVGMGHHGPPTKYRRDAVIAEPTEGRHGLDLVPVAAPELADWPPPSASVAHPVVPATHASQLLLNVQHVCPPLPALRALAKNHCMDSCARNGGL
jgi:hypothetical protein